MSSTKWQTQRNLEARELLAAGVRWHAGRQTVEVTLLATKMSEGQYPSLKGLWKRADGAKLWCSVPSVMGRYTPERGDVVRFSIDVSEPNSAEPYFAFGRRPTKPVLVSRANPESEAPRNG